MFRSSIADDVNTVSGTITLEWTVVAQRATILEHCNDHAAIIVILKLQNNNDLKTEKYRSIDKRSNQSMQFLFSAKTFNEFDHYIVCSNGSLSNDVEYVFFGSTNSSHAYLVCCIAGLNLSSLIG